MNHEAIIYRGITLLAKDSPDGESPSGYAVTKEVSGHAIWRFSHDAGETLLMFVTMESRDAAIEKAVERVLEERAALAKAGAL